MWSLVAELPSRTSLVPSLCAVSGEIEAVGSFCISDVRKRSLVFSRAEVIVLKFMFTLFAGGMDTLARGLRCAAKILEDNVLPRYVKVSIIHLYTCPHLLCCMHDVGYVIHNRRLGKGMV